MKIPLLETDGIDPFEPLYRDLTPLCQISFMGGRDSVLRSCELANQLWDRTISMERWVELEWFGVRTIDVSRPDLYLSPDPEKYIEGAISGVLDFEDDLQLLTLVAKKLRTRFDGIYINLEQGPHIWMSSGDPGSTQAEAYRRNWYVIESLLADPEVRKRLPDSLLSIPHGTAELALNWQTGGPEFAQRQMDIADFFRRLHIRSLNRCIAKAGITTIFPKIYSFAGSWKRFTIDENGHQQAPCNMRGVGSNWQCYEPGVKATARYAAMSDSNFWVPTYHGEISPEDLTTRLAHCTRSHYMLFAPNPRVVDGLLPVIRRYLK